MPNASPNTISSLSDLQSSFSVLFDHSSENICIYDTHKKPVYANPAFLKKLGLSSDLHLQDITYHHTPQPEYIDALNRVIYTHKPDQTLIDILQNNGLHLYDLVHFFPIFSPNKSLLGILAQWRDLDYSNYLKQLDEKKHTEYLRALLDTFPFIVWMKDHEGRFLEVNQKFADIVSEPSPDKLYGKTDFDYFPTEMAQGFVDDDKKIVSSGVAIELEEQIQKANGEIYWAETYKSPVTLNGVTIGSVGFARDISEKKRLISEVQKSSNDYQALVEHLPVNIIRYDLNYQRIFLSSHFLRKHQQQQQYHLNTTPEDQWSPDIVTPSPTDYMHILQKVLTTGKEHNFEVHTCINGVPEYYEAKAVAEYNQDGQIVGAMVIGWDVTEKRRLQTTAARRAKEYQNLVQNLPMTIIRYDLHCRRVYISSHCQQKYNLPQQYELYKTPTQQWSDSIINMTGEDFQAHIQNVIASKTEFNCELYSYHDGKTTVHHVKIVPEYGEHLQVVGALTIAQDVTENAEYRRKIESLAYTDTLTDLPNRENFNLKLAQLSEVVKMNNSNLGMLMIDLDHFKGVNDALGHAMGDQLLNEVSNRINASIRSEDMLARLGGDEFAILVNSMRGTQNLSLLAQKIIHQLSTPFVIEGKEFYITASIGIASLPEHTNSPENLLKYADAAMYVAKKNGRNNYQYFSHEIDKGNSLRMSIQTELRHAIENAELYIEYQPIYQLQTRQPVRYEALMRWYNKKLKQVSPADFIHVAEEFGIIVEIGEWLILEVCKHAAAINLGRSTPLIFSINLSPRQFLRNDILKTLRKGLARYSCDPTWIEVEITEGLLLNHNTETLNMLEGIANMGIHIAMDDFGTGYSSLSYLNKYPISTVKIDQSFTRDISKDINDAKLVKAIIEMAKSLDKTVTAEGIETEQQMSMLKEWGCELGQGYLLGRPQRSENINW